MISHIVLFRPKPTLTAGERALVLVALQRAIDGIPFIRRVTIGRRIKLNRPGYETLMTEHFEYSAVFEFDSEENLRSYLDHPAHAELGKTLFASADAVLAYDFSYVAPEDLTRSG
jgi:hypothetical protein